MQLLFVGSFFSCTSQTNKTDSSFLESNIELDSIISSSLVVTDPICENWNINKAELFKLIQSFDTLSGYEWHQCYGVFNCKIEGEILVRGERNFYSLNAGGWVRLWNKDQEIFRGTRNPEDSTSFISINFCDENWD